MNDTTSIQNNKTGISIREILSIPVIVAALGYFVDIYDLILFSIVRVQSLKSMGIDGQALMDKGVFLLNMQMAGIKKEELRYCSAPFFYIPSQISPMDSSIPWKAMRCGVLLRA